MMLSLSNTGTGGFDSLLLAVLAFNALVIVVLTYAPKLHGTLSHWVWPKNSQL